MAGALIRDVRRAVLTRLRQDAGLTAIVAAANIHPSTVPANPVWPFTRFDAPQSTPIDGACYAGAKVTFMLHSFAKPRMNASGQMIETAEDHAGRILDAMKLAIHKHRVPVAGASALLSVVSARMMIDGAESTAYHGVLSCRARVLAA